VFPDLLLLYQRATFGWFPWRFVDGESSISRIVAMVDDDCYGVTERSLSPGRSGHDARFLYVDDELSQLPLRRHRRRQDPGSSGDTELNS